MGASVCWGIELGSGAVKALKLARDGDELKVLEYAVIPHKRVLSTPELDQRDAMRVALGSLVSQYDLSGAPIAVSVPGHSAFARFAKLPPVEPKKIPDIVKFEAVQQIPFPIDDVEWDYQTFQSPDSPDVEVGIFAITRDRVMEKLAMWADVGITPEHLTLSPVAAYNAMAWDLQFTERTPGTVILDVGTTSTDLIIAEEGRVWIRTFPVGGHNFTEALVNTFKLSYLKAEKLKREAEQSRHARHVFQALRPVFADLAQDVQRSVGYYQSLHRDAKLTRLVVFGSTFNLPGLRKYLGQQLQMEVVRLERFHRIDIDGPASAEFHAATLNLATAYGLALQGLGLQTIRANLMPKLVMREAAWRKKKSWFAAAAGLAIVGAGASFVGPLMDQTGLAGRPKSPTISKVKNDVTRLRNEWAELEARFPPDYRAANALLLLDNRKVYPQIVADTGELLAHAASRASDGQPFLFDELQTEYMPAGAGASPAGGPGSPFGGPFGGADDPYGEGMDPDAGRGGFGETEEQPRRVRVTLTLSTARTANEAERFLTQVMQQWLFDAGDRGPYVIDDESVRWDKTGSSSAEVGEIGADGEIIPPPDSPFPTAPNRFQPGEGRDPRLAGDPRSPRGHDTGMPSEPAFGPAGFPGSQAPIGADPAQADLQGLAPIDPPAPKAPPGTTLHTYTITWDAVIKSDDEETQS
jgi:type IV pilus assembly protein PilM